MPYTTQDIFSYLKRTFFLGLNTMGETDINSRIMLFACSADLRRFYFLTPSVTQKVADIKANPIATLNILSHTDKVEDYAETIVKGTAVVLTEYNHADVQEGFLLLMEKSSMVKAIYGGKTMADYCMIRIDVKSIAFGIYSDILKKIPLTKLRF